MNKLIPIEEHFKKRYVYKIKGKGNKYHNAFFVKSQNVKKISTKGKEVSEADVLIAYRNSIGLERVNSTLSYILDSIWASNLPNARVTRARIITRFLNWTLINKDVYKNYSSLADLKLEMFKDYLNDSKHDLEHYSHKITKMTLELFYKELHRNELINEKFEEEYIEREFDSIGISHFYRKNVKHNLIKPLAKILVDVCEMTTPDILLGVMLGMFGGVRCGELVNLTRRAVRFVGVYDMSLNIQTRNLRPDIDDIREKGTAKVTRKQKVYYSDIGIELYGDSRLRKIYEKHIYTYKVKDGSNALFVDKNGQAMTAATFKKRFKKLKKAFINTIESNNDPLIYAYSQKVKAERWGTHILRGIFTNLYANKVGNSQLGIKMLQKARGDSNPKSAMKYLMDIDEVNRQQEEALHGMRQKYFKEKPKAIKTFKSLEYKGEEHE